MNVIGESSPGFRSGYVALLGRPNVGKSTLVNALVDRKVSITSDKPQTTRHRVTGVVTTDDYQLVLLDIPGVQRPRDQLTERMQGRVEQTLTEVDVVLFMLPADEEPGPGDRFIANRLAELRTPVLVAINKVDLVGEESVTLRRDVLRRMGFADGVFAVSALKGSGVPALRLELSERLPEGPLYFPRGTKTDQPEELLIAELIREQAIRVTQDEVPHSLAVQVEEMAPRKGGELFYVRALIYVERDSQRPIVLGEGGERIKEIGSEARREAEALLGSKFYLDLGVKVRKRWRRDSSMLERLGL